RAGQAAESWTIASTIAMHAASLRVRSPTGPSFMLNIAHVSVEPLTIGLHEPLGIATGAQSRADNVLVRVRLSDDTVGWGEAAPFPAVSGETQGLVMSTLTQHVEGFAGRPIDQWRRLCREAAERLSASASATCALQCALLDAWLRSHHCSMWSF